jgi:hypothetical protein
MPQRFIRTLAATLNCLADHLNRPSRFARTLVDTATAKASLSARLANPAASLKQAVFGHLREF